MWCCDVGREPGAQAERKKTEAVYWAAFRGGKWALKGAVWVGHSHHCEKTSTTSIREGGGGSLVSSPCLGSSRSPPLKGSISGLSTDHQSVQTSSLGKGRRLGITCRHRHNLGLFLGQLGFQGGVCLPLKQHWMRSAPSFRTMRSTHHSANWNRLKFRFGHLRSLSK